MFWNHTYQILMRMPLVMATETMKIGAIYLANVQNAMSRTAFHISDNLMDEHPIPVPNNPGQTGLVQPVQPLPNPYINSRDTPLARVADFQTTPTPQQQNKTEKPINSQINKGDRSMSHQEFSEDYCTVVDYQIVFVKRDYEAMLDSRSAIVVESMDGNGFTAWKIAEFIDRMKSGHIELPHEWEKSKLDVVPGTGNYDLKDNKLTGLSKDDQKELRVTFQILQTVDRPAAQYEEDKVDALKDIASTLKNGNLTVKAI